MQPKEIDLGKHNLGNEDGKYEVVACVSSQRGQKTKDGGHQHTVIFATSKFFESFNETKEDLYPSTFFVPYISAILPPGTCIQ